MTEHPLIIGIVLFWPASILIVFLIRGWWAFKEDEELASLTLWPIMLLIFLMAGIAAVIEMGAKRFKKG